MTRVLHGQKILRVQSACANCGPKVQGKPAVEVWPISVTLFVISIQRSQKSPIASKQDDAAT